MKRRKTNAEAILRDNNIIRSQVPLKEDFAGELSLSEKDTEDLGSLRDEMPFEAIVSLIGLKKNRSQEKDFQCLLAAISQGRFISSKTGKWAEDPILPDLIQKVVDWQQTIIGYSKRLNLSVTPREITLQWLKSDLSLLKRKKEFYLKPPAKLPSAKAYKLTNGEIATAFLPHLNVLNVRALRSNQGTDENHRKALATSKIFKGHGFKINDKSIKASLRKSLKNK